MKLTENLVFTASYKDGKTVTEYGLENFLTDEDEMIDTEEDLYWVAMQLIELDTQDANLEFIDVEDTYTNESGDIVKRLYTCIA